jgi:triacylglycerol lipase
MSEQFLHPVVLTPGFRDNERKLSWLAAQMQRSGLHPIVISPQPSDASVGIDSLAVALAKDIEIHLGPNQPFDFFGFSMGGLIGRYYVQCLGGAERVRRLVTLATPHRGSWTARLLLPRPALLQMYPDSLFLQELNQDLTLLSQHEFVALWTPFDLSVMPAHYGYLPTLPSLRLFSPFHATLVHDPIVVRAVMNAFRPDKG